MEIAPEYVDVALIVSSRTFPAYRSPWLPQVRLIASPNNERTNPIMTEPWLSTHIERWSPEKLVPYARNARTHSEEQVAQIAASIVEFGFTNPILAGSDGVIVAGHGRLAAAQKLGLDTVPVVVLDRHGVQACFGRRQAPVTGLRSSPAGSGWQTQTRQSAPRYRHLSPVGPSISGDQLGIWVETMGLVLSLKRQSKGLTRVTGHHQQHPGTFIRQFRPSMTTTSESVLIQ